AERVAVPGGAGARLEGDADDLHAGWRRRLGERVAADPPGEIFGRAGARRPGAVAGDLHAGCLLAGRVAVAAGRIRACSGQPPWPRWREQSSWKGRPMSDERIFSDRMLSLGLARVSEAAAIAAAKLVGTGDEK